MYRRDIYIFFTLLDRRRLREVKGRRKMLTADPKTKDLEMVRLDYGTVFR